jgi:hypothetical protein
MVQDGAFEVTLLDARTNKPFREIQGPDDSNYVVIKSCKEYFVEIKASGSAPRFKAEIFVDGESLGYRYRSKQAGACVKKLGLRSVSQGESTLHALKFKEIKSIFGDDASFRADDDMTVRVDLYEVEEEWERKSRTTDLEISWQGADDTIIKSGIYSSKGTIQESGPALSQRVFKTGDFLASIKLHYRSHDDLKRILTDAEKEAREPQAPTRVVSIPLNCS